MLSGGALVGGSAVSHGLAILSELGTTDLHFVAEDWVSGTWAARLGGWSATLNGSLTKANSAQFTGRKALTGWSDSNNFVLASNTAHTFHSTDSFTYEFLFGLYPTPASNSVFFGGLINNVTWAGYLFNATSTIQEFYITLSTANNFFLGGDTATNQLNYAKANLITITLDGPNHVMRLYVNGAAITSGAFPDSTTTGLLIPQDCAFGIGARQFAGSAGIGIPSTTEFMEILRHRTILDASTITARAAQFNALKGY